MISSDTDRAVVTCIVSGKGGVGKSMFAVNLAETLVRDGRRVALVDVDLGQNACDILMNEAPQYTVFDLARHASSLNEVLHRTTSGITLVTAIAEVGRSDGRQSALYESLDHVVDHLKAVHDIVLIDAPAGTEGPVRWGLDRSDFGVLVLVEEPTAVSNAYRLAKLVWERDPAYKFIAVVNFVEHPDEGKSVTDRFNAITSHFTGSTVEYLGAIPLSADIRRAVRLQTPVVRDKGLAREAFDAVARMFNRRILAAEVARPD